MRSADVHIALYKIVPPRPSTHDIFGISPYAA